MFLPLVRGKLNNRIQPEGFNPSPQTGEEIMKAVKWENELGWNVVDESGIVRFEINETAVKISGLTISYLLLNTAKIVNPVKGKQ